MKWIAGQMVYTRLEASESPSGKAGYQTVGVTPGLLTPEELRMTESRMVFHAGTAHSKDVYFPLPSGVLVLARLAMLPERDSAGRAVYAAHALILPAGTVSQGSLDITALFETFPFAVDRSAITSLARAGCPPVEVDMKPCGPPSCLLLWGADELLGLAGLALAVNRLEARRMMAQVTGPSSCCREVAAIAHFLLPARVAARISFDAFVADCAGNLGIAPGQWYWAVGMPEPRTAPNLVTVDGAARRMPTKFTWTPTNVYEEWLAHVVQTGNWDIVARVKEQAWLVSCAFDGSLPPETIGQLPGGVITSILASAPIQAGRRFVTAMGKINPTLAQRAAPAIINAQPAIIAKGLSEGFAPEVICQALGQAYESTGFTRPAPDEYQAARSLARKTREPALSLLIASWEGDIASIRRLSLVLDPDLYAALLAFARNVMDRATTRDPRKQTPKSFWERMLGR